MGNPFALLLSLCIFIRVESIDLFGSYVNQDGAEYVYQLPATRGGGVVGVVFLAHGCSHSSTDWWPQGGQCESCLGLPVEQAIVRFALSLNYAAIAISSSNRRHKCWISPDRGKVSMILNNFYVDFLQGDLSTPLYMVGASSGGAFVAALAQSPDLKAKVGAVCVQISSVRKPTAVPTLFVLMKRDEATLQDVREKAAGGYFADHRILLCGPRAITPAYLSAMGAVRSEADSSAIHKALLHHGLLDQATFFLLEDPRHSSWRQAVAPVLAAAGAIMPGRAAEADTLQPDLSPVSEALNVAWAQHELTAEHLDQVFGWFKDHRPLSRAVSY